MSFVKKLEFGNYTLKFGNMVLLDLFNEIVFPSFKNRDYVRKHGETEYVFTQIKLKRLLISAQENIGPSLPVYAIIGRIVKKAKIKREQILIEGEIKSDPKELDTAPSSIFMLMLNDHRLIFCREMAGAPTLDEFMNTSQAFLMNRYNSYINYQLNKNKKQRKKRPSINKLTKKDLQQKIPSPKLRITPLTDPRTLESFIFLFSKIKRLNVKLLPTNNEDLSMDSFWQQLQNEKEESNSEDLSLTYVNNNEGLNTASVLQKTVSATQMANSKVKIIGEDTNGDKLAGNNDTFSLVSEEPTLPTDIDDAAIVSFEKYKNLRDEGSISSPRDQENVSTIGKIIKLCERWLNHD